MLQTWILLAGLFATPLAKSHRLIDAGLKHARDSIELEVDVAPQSPRPYVIRQYANANSTAVGSQIYRFPVTGNSSGGAFSLMSTSAPGSDALGVLPHIHEAHYENFFTLKGRVQLWTQKDDEQQARLLTAGDYGAAPPGTNHTFQMIEPDNDLTGVIVPGGFEALFFALGTSWTSLTHTPHDPAPDNTSSNVGGDESVITALEAFDVYAQLAFEPRRDFVNGTAPVDGVWHTGFNDIANDSAPFFVANNYGPKYLNSQYFYQIVQPLVNPSAAAAAGNYDFTLSTIAINFQLNNQTKPVVTLDGAAAFEVLEGVLMIQIGFYTPSTLYTGDVAFVPANTTFSYWSPAAYTKTLYVGAGNNSWDQQLINGGENYGYPTFPLY